MLQSGLLKADASKQKFQNQFHYQKGRLWFLNAYPIENLAESNFPEQISPSTSQTRLFSEDDSKPNSPRKDCRASYSTQICSSRFLNCNSSAPLAQQKRNNVEHLFAFVVFEQTDHSKSYFQTRNSFEQKIQNYVSRPDVPKQSLPPMFLKVNFTQRIHPFVLKHITDSILL